METIIVVPSISTLENVKAFNPALKLGTHEPKILVIDEGNERIRRKNKEILHGIPHAFYGPKEREEWFAQRFGSMQKLYSSVIPTRCHAETSFGFLAAYEEEPDFIIELDDDVSSIDSHNFAVQHASNLFGEEGVTVFSRGQWYNVMENLELNSKVDVFPRGHPYSRETRIEEYSWNNNDDGKECVLNMGLWIGYPDLDALTILNHFGLDGRGDIKSRFLKRDKVIVGRNTYFSVCSMNTSFVPKIIPAFYQLFMNFMNVNRFDDIWSGIFIKKIADHLDEKVCLGKPLVYHSKRPRNIFEDLKKEAEGMNINEVLWKIVASIELEGTSYWDCYNSLADELERNLTNLNLKLKKFILKQTQKMRLWLRIVDKIN